MFTLFRCHCGVRKVFVKWSKAADLLRIVGQACPVGGSQAHRFAKRSRTRFAPDYSPCLWLFILCYSSSCPACSITSLTVRDARQQFPPSTLLAGGHGWYRAGAQGVLPGGCASCPWCPMPPSFTRYDQGGVCSGMDLTAPRAWSGLPRPPAGWLRPSVTARPPLC
jgi:hypothetical protein